MDETWVHQYDRLTKDNLKSGCNLVPLDQNKKNYVQKWAGKSVFWDKGFLLIEYLGQGRAIMRTYHTKLLPQLRRKIVKKYRIKLAKVLILQDNTSVHKSLDVMEKISEIHSQLIDDLPYSPDLAPLNYYLFPKFKTTFAR